MYVAVIPNRSSPPAILLRESYREAGKTKNRTLANLSRWPAERIEQLRAVLRGDQLLPAAEAVEIVRALPHGHVLPRAKTRERGIESRRQKERPHILALVVRGDDAQRLEALPRHPALRRGMQSRVAFEIAGEGRSGQQASQKSRQGERDSAFRHPPVPPSPMPVGRTCRARGSGRRAGRPALSYCRFVLRCAREYCREVNEPA